jgi:hypothetical protein
VSQLDAGVSFFNKEIGKKMEKFSLSSLNLTNFANAFLISYLSTYTS